MSRPAPVLALLLGLGLSACSPETGSPGPDGAAGDTTAGAGGTSAAGAPGTTASTGDGGTMTGTAGTAGSGGSGGEGAGSGGSGAGGGTAGSGGGECAPTGFGPQAAPYQVDIGGQTAWVHDEGFSSGYFHTFDALQVGGPGDAGRKVHVFLPKGYAQSCDEYPVVYMNDGNTTFWPGGAAGKSWNVAQGLASLYAEGAVPEVIVVAVHPIDREAEYTHTDWAPGHTCCGIAGYADYLADHVKGFVDAHYRTRPEASQTAVVGSSHGGLAAFLVAGLRPDRFRKAGCLSSSFWAGLDIFQLGGGPLAGSALLDLTEGTLSDPALRPELWIDWGLVRTGGFHNSIIEAAATDRGKEMVALLKGSYGFAEGQGLLWMEDPDGGHDEDTWAKRFPLVMKALYGAP